ncbi:hypothetical protein N0V95_008389 [Ascochyta clinopodiicola]|nr:hypothetical protein N0V95_008389 [Ascochyta clinopodiicola]
MDEESEETETELDGLQAELLTVDDKDELANELSCDAVELGDWDAELELEGATLVAAEDCGDCHDSVEEIIPTGGVVDSTCDVDAVHVPEFVRAELGNADDQDWDGHDAGAEDSEIEDAEEDGPEEDTTGPEVDRPAEDEAALVPADVEAEEGTDEASVGGVMEEPIAEDPVLVSLADVKAGVEGGAEDAADDD